MGKMYRIKRGILQPLWLRERFVQRNSLALTMKAAGIPLKLMVVVCKYLRSCTLSPSFSSRNLMSSVMSSSSYFCCSRFSSCFSTLHWIMAKAYSWRVSLSADFSRRFCEQGQNCVRVYHHNLAVIIWTSQWSTLQNPKNKRLPLEDYVQFFKTHRG